MAASLLEKATSLQQTVSAVRVVAAARQDAARLHQRLIALQSTVADLRRAQAVFVACRAIDTDADIGRPDTTPLTTALASFRRVYEEQGDIDQAALSLTAALNALREDLRAKVAAWWHPYASSQVRNAGADAIDLLEPNDQAAARHLVVRLREAVATQPKIPLDVTRFTNDLASLADAIAENQVADLPEQLRAVLRDVGARRMRLSDLTPQTLHLLKERGYADRLSIYWGSS